MDCCGVSWAVVPGERIVCLQGTHSIPLCPICGEVQQFFFEIQDGFAQCQPNHKNQDFNTEGNFCGSYASFISEVPSHFNVVAMEVLELLLINRACLMAQTEKHMAWQKFLRIAMQSMFIAKENREAAFLTLWP